MIGFHNFFLFFLSFSFSCNSQQNKQVFSRELEI